MWLGAILLSHRHAAADAAPHIEDVQRFVRSDEAPVQWMRIYFGLSIATALLHMRTYMPLAWDGPPTLTLPRGLLLSQKLQVLAVATLTGCHAWMGVYAVREFGLAPADQQLRAFLLGWVLVASWGLLGGLGALLILARTCGASGRCVAVAPLFCCHLEATAAAPYVLLDWAAQLLGGSAGAWCGRRVAERRAPSVCLSTERELLPVRVPAALAGAVDEREWSSFREEALEARQLAAQRI